MPPRRTSAPSATRPAPGLRPDSVSYSLESEAELALWRGHPQAASWAADQSIRVAPEDRLRGLLMASIGLRAEADRSELAGAPPRSAPPRGQRPRPRANLSRHRASARATPLIRPSRRRSRPPPASRALRGGPPHSADHGPDHRTGPDERSACIEFV